MATIYGTMVAHRLILQYLFAKVAETTPDPSAFVREIIATTITSMGSMAQGGEPEINPLMRFAAEELELIGKNLELRLGAMQGKAPPP
jgi:hypothetical protein